MGDITEEAAGQRDECLKTKKKKRCSKPGFPLNPFFMAWGALMEVEALNIPSKPGSDLTAIYICLSVDATPSSVAEKEPIKA